MTNWHCCLKGLLAGLVIALVGNIGYIVFLYAPFDNGGFYFMAMPSAIAVFFLIKNKSLKSLIVSVIIMLVSFIAWELIISGLQIVNLFYYNKYPNAVEFSLGDGFAMVIIYIFDFFGALVGTVLAFIQTTKR